MFDGYTFYSDTYASSRVDGIGVYVKNSFMCNKLNSLKINSTNKNTVENIWLEIYGGGNINISWVLFTETQTSTLRISMHCLTHDCVK